MTDDPELYREILLDHGQHPRGDGLLDPCDLATEGSNADTGDVVRLTVRLAEGQIAEMGFTAEGSAVLRASCSLMTEALTGQSTVEAAAKADQFMALLRGESDDDNWDGLGDAVALRGIRQFPARVRCAILPWRTFARLIAQ
ncbi:Fe-S cluster assembly sulfur transfer protein SufU [Cerasicoccus arenae]|uniref:Iron-sulfur cluster assembly scaffold protein NifU n=1 Tax=Cerasicoccus arenae TaxID=424488 RepID=A0A8J3DF60_9BACT|nr:SUF system NifU family Fe-S cluster assembly protein [Cerasicoccus arenae]MBK1859963.1 SUF system NifU family Fe-S cluster assembly protein [Cerasicoccus arenae]GHC12671.1 iron-sulfur cluster assembly scaffold protein NifU [Cerasicoccus arenae]